MDIDIIENQRRSFKHFMLKNKLNAFSWAKKAGISEATIRHYLSGRNNSLTSVNIERLAKSVGASAQDLIGNINVDYSDSQNEINSFEVNRELFTQVFIDFEDFIIKNDIKVSSKVRANILLSWYQLTELMQKTGETSSSPELFQELFYKIAAEG
jgi:transcriptional regulator with XRE-family HTH domain